MRFNINANSNTWDIGLQPYYNNFLFRLGTSVKGRLDGNGNFYCSGSFSSGSDIRLKSQIEDVDNEVLATLFDKVEVNMYKKQEHEDEPEFDIGFIANDIGDNITNLGFYNLVQKDSSNDDMMSLSYDRMITILWGQVKILKAEIELLKSKKP